MVKAPKTIPSRSLLAALVAVAVVATLGTVQSSQAAKPPIVYKGQVAITQLFTTAAAPYFIAQRLGFYGQAGLQFKLVNFNGGTDTINAIRTTTGFGFASTGAGLLGVANGVDIKIVGGGFNAPGEQWIVPTNSPLRTIQDMRGRVTKIGVTRPGSNTEFEIKGIAKLLGLTIGKDIQLVYIGDLSALWTAAKQGLIDAAASGPPLSTQLVLAGEARVWFKASQYYHLPNTVSWASTDFIRDHPDVIRRWMKVQQRANKLIRKEPDRAARAYAKAMNIDPAVARKALDEYKSAYSVNILKRGIQNVLKVQVVLGILKSVDQVNIDDVIDPRFVPVT